MIFYVLNCNYYYFLCVFFYSLGNYPRIVVIDRLRDHLTSLAFAESTRKNMQSHLNAYLSFCNNFNFRSFPLNVIVVSRYVSYLAHVGRRFGTIQNHISSLKHFHQVYGFSSGWEQQYFFRLIIKGTKRYLGMQATRKKAITPLMLHRMAFFFHLRIPLHAAMWALFLVAFFSFLRNSNLVVKNMRSVSSVKVLHCSHLILNENTAFLRILATKTIQFAQRSLIFHCQLSLDLFCAQSPLCIHISSCIRCPLVLHSFPFAPAIESRFKPLLIHSFRVFWLGPYKLSGQIPVNFPLIAFGTGGRLSLLIAVFQQN